MPCLSMTLKRIKTFIKASLNKSDSRTYKPTGIFIYFNFRPALKFNFPCRLIFQQQKIRGIFFIDQT